MYNYVVRYQSYNAETNTSLYGIVSKKLLTHIDVFNKLLEYCLSEDDELIQIYSIEEREIEP